MLKVSLDCFAAHKKLVRNLLGFDRSLRNLAERAVKSEQIADPEFGGRQHVRIEMLAMLPSVCQLQLLAGLFCQAFGAARLRQFDCPPKERSGRAILTRSPQLRAEPVSEPGLEHPHTAFRGARNRVVEQPLLVTLGLRQGGP